MQLFFHNDAPCIVQFFGAENFEVNAIFYDKELARELKNNFLIDISNSEKLNLQKWEQRSIFIKFSERFFRLISPLV